MNNFITNLKKLIKFVICCSAVGLLLVGVTLVYKKHNEVILEQLNQLHEKIELISDASVGEHLSRLDDQIAALQTNQISFISKEDLVPLKQEVSDLSIQMNKIVTQSHTQNQTLNKLTEKTQQLQTGFSEFKKLVQSGSSSSSSSSSRADKNSSPLPKKKSTLHKKVVVAPFILNSVERRGGVQFVALSPHYSSRLSDVILIRVGESYQGWKLISIQGRSVTFNVFGQLRTLIV